MLGGGTGGTIAANRLRRAVGDARITVVDRDDDYVYQPRLLFLPFGLADRSTGSPVRLLASRYISSSTPRR